MAFFCQNWAYLILTMAEKVRRIACPIPPEITKKIGEISGATAEEIGRVYAILAAAPTGEGASLYELEIHFNVVDALLELGIIVRNDTRYAFRPMTEGEIEKLQP